MANLDQILMRLPRKIPDAGFVDRFFAQIRGTGFSTPAPSITHLDLILLDPDCIESIGPAMLGGKEFMQAESIFSPPPVMQNASSPDISRFATLSHLS